jgi:hypothetical protein
MTVIIPFQLLIGFVRGSDKLLIRATGQKNQVDLRLHHNIYQTWPTIVATRLSSMAAYVVGYAILRGQFQGSHIYYQVV